MHPSRAYGNIEVYSPDGELMFHTNDSKLKFYKEKNLIEQIGENKYRLLFEPNGKGHADRNVELLEPRINQCVCCGQDDILALTRHHIVPTRFRKYLPENIKGNNHRYVVFLCTECHNEYGDYEMDLNNLLAMELGVDTLRECASRINIEKRIITGIANTILYRDMIPESRISELKEEFKTRTGLDPTDDNLHKVRKKKYEPVSDENNFGKLVVDNIKNVYEFQQRWLEHFVHTMQPRFLPKDLLILL